MPRRFGGSRRRADAVPTSTVGRHRDRVGRMAGSASPPERASDGCGGMGRSRLLRFAELEPLPSRVERGWQWHTGSGPDTCRVAAPPQQDRAVDRACIPSGGQILRRGGCTGHDVRPGQRRGDQHPDPQFPGQLAQRPKVLVDGGGRRRQVHRGQVVDRHQGKAAPSTRSRDRSIRPPAISGLSWARTTPARPALAGSTSWLRNPAPLDRGGSGRADKLRCS